MVRWDMRTVVCSQVRNVETRTSLGRVLTKHYRNIRGTPEGRNGEVIPKYTVHGDKGITDDVNGHILQKRRGYIQT